ncbi:MAG TPA: DNA repair protein RecO [Acidobacteriota bacterium]|nr:DNA repair protein RecO [Acidobacteriota bacterium]
MKYIQVEALTLRTYSFGEANKIAVFLTKTQGKLRAVAYGAGKSKSRFGSGLEPLTHLRISFGRRQNQELAIVQSCEIIRAFPAYRLSWEQNLHFSYFAELLIEFTSEAMESERLFRLALAVLDAVEKVPISLLARYFEFWLLRLEGVLPPLKEKLPEDLAARLIEMMRRPPVELASFSFSTGELERLERAASELIEYHLEKPLRARKILKELL